MNMSRMSVLLVAAAIFIGACSRLPTSTRTGKVYDIIITDREVEPRDLVVGKGDEVRFRNEGTKPPYVFFFKDFLDELSCQRGFKFFWGTEEEAKIDPGESASLCFNRPGTVAYRVQWEPTEFGGIGGTPGKVEIPPSINGAIVVNEAGKIER